MSEGALKEAHRRKVDLFRAEWSQQPRFDPGRSVFRGLVDDADKGHLI